MNNIGQKIKELRRKNDMTQEKLADFLGVTYQSVSKWETGITMPDLSLIVPLARLLHVSTDELLGMASAEKDERKAYFDAEYFEFWKKDHEKDLEIARRAVEEYPGDYRYLHWLASDEFYVGYSVDNIGTDTEKELLSNAVKHYEIVLENCMDTDLRNHAIAGLVYIYVALHKPDEAKKYAEMYPEAPEFYRDVLLVYCLQGEERDQLIKKRIKKAMQMLVGALSDSDAEIEAMDAEETMIKAIISDGNYQHFNISLSMIYESRAKIAMENGDVDEAERALLTALHHAKEYDKMREEGVETYTCPILCGYVEDHKADRKEHDWTMVSSIKQSASNELFAPLRNREDFKALLELE